VTRVLIVDDEPQIRRALGINLRAREYQVVDAADGTSALKATASEHPDLILLDLGLPDIDGVDVIRELRTWTTVPIVVLSGRSDSRDKVDALDAGADDYVTKPFSVVELLARIRAVARRLTDADTPTAVQRVGDYDIDLTARTVRDCRDTERLVHLTRTEWKVIDLLLRNPGCLISQRQLLQTAWGPAYVNETNYLRQYIKQLRAKLEPDPARPKHILTDPGMGYRFQP
jgi:two-component system KDP operon response regulator KdpE